MKKNTKWMIGGGLVITLAIIAGLAVMYKCRDYGGYKGYGKMMNWSDHDGDHDGGMRKGHHDKTLAALQTSLGERFAGLDSNGDGALSADEYSAKALDRFTKTDTDKDGEISRKERKQAYKSHKEMRDSEM